MSPHADTQPPTPDERPWTFALAADGDLIINDAHTFDLIDGAEAIEQDLKVAIQTLRGEDRRDSGFGLALFRAVRSDAALEREVRRTLEYDDYRHERIQSVPDITIERAESGVRHGVRVTATVQLASGVTRNIDFEVGN